MIRPLFPDWPCWEKSCRPPIGLSHSINSLMNKKSVLVLITSDPRQSHRAAEGVRVAAGLASWSKGDFSVYLGPAALQLLSEFPEDCRGFEVAVQNLPLLGRRSPVLINKPPNEFDPPAHIPLRLTTPEELAQLAARSDVVLCY